MPIEREKYWCLDKIQRGKIKETGLLNSRALLLLSELIKIEK